MHTTTEQIADAIELTSKLLELHNENPFKIKSLANAAYTISKSNIDLQQTLPQDLERIEGIGKSIAQKISELIETGSTKELSQLLEKTPQGVVELLGIKGLGPKKVRQLWHELGIDSPLNLLYACNENRLIALKGFGQKTQQSILQNTEFKLSNKGRLHYAYAEKIGDKIITELKQKASLVCYTGAMHRKCEIIEQIEIIISDDAKNINDYNNGNYSIPIKITQVPKESFYYHLVITSSSPEHLAAFTFTKITERNFDSEIAVYENISTQYCEPELREGLFEIERIKKNQLPQLITQKDLRGCLHNHSTYSDGLNTIEEMAMACKNLGLEYFGIADHSQTAVYANGLKPEQIIQQHYEIELLNKKIAPFKIFKGIESDVLNNGDLDYPDEILKTFDFVVASIHQNFKMDEYKATERLIKAIENPYTSILGHLTGRLLLDRMGYPVNHKKIIDACAANGVSIELNAHPYRLDMDWRHLPYCIEKGVLISINPDAHHVSSITDMRYGVNVARKGLLTSANCLNAMSLVQFENFLKTKK
ncbi:MAG: DNA polymerase/3'-5' exonuclease PolX [Bacteroidetes bacterium]|nr:DNA polymerase/3'-5' exonuclease PolX [Bacteroidota bacterium]